MPTELHQLQKYNPIFSPYFINGIGYIDKSPNAQSFIDFCNKFLFYMLLSMLFKCSVP